MKVLGFLTVSLFTALGGWVLSAGVYAVLFGTIPPCGYADAFSGLVGGRGCGEGNACLTPYLLGSLAFCAAFGTWRWVRFVRSLDAEDTVRTW